MKSFFHKLIVILFTFSLLNCNNSSKNTEAKDFINEEKEILISTLDNDEKVEELGGFITDALLNQDIDKYLSKFDIDYFTNKAANNIGLSTKNKFEFKKGLKTGVSSLPRDISARISNGALYDFISYRYDTTEKAYFMLFRFFTDEEGMNYHDYRVSRIDDKFMFSDMYVYITGENLSKTMNRLMLAGMSSNKLMAMFEPNKKVDFNKAIKATKYMKTGDYQKAYDAYNTMSSGMRNQKFVLIMKGQAASMLSDELYQKTMGELLKNHPNDNSLSLNFIDYYLTKEDYHKTLEMTNNLKKETDDDFLEYIIGNINYLKGDFTAAKNNFRYMTENYENFYSAYYSYMGCLVKDKEYDEIVIVLNKLLTQNYTKSELIDYIESEEDGMENEFEDFMRSKEYMNWKRK